MLKNRINEINAKLGEREIINDHLLDGIRREVDNQLRGGQNALERARTVDRHFSAAAIFAGFDVHRLPTEVLPLVEVV